MALYGAPIWAGGLCNQNRAVLRRAQRVMAIRIVRGYRTISCEAACVLAGTPPWDLDAEVLSEAYWRRRATARATGGGEAEPVTEERDREALLRKWRSRLEEPTAGKRTVEAIRPILLQWVDRGHGALTFRAVQILSGHGCFGKYLCGVAGREPTSVCHFCGYHEDTAEHTLADCPEWAEPRAALVDAVGNDLSLPGVVKSMVDSDRAWKAVLQYCEAVMARKEAAERAREEDPLSNPIRRRRVGRRRMAHERRLPP